MHIVLAVAGDAGGIEDRLCTHRLAMTGMALDFDVGTRQWKVRL